MNAFEVIAASGTLEPLDLHFAHLIQRRARRGDSDPGGVDVVALTAALLSNQRSRGHSCIDLRDWAGRPFPTDDGTMLPPLPDPLSWRQALTDSALVDDVDDPDQAPATPLVRDAAGRLYLSRYWRAEQRLAASLRERLESAPPAVDTRALSPLFRTLFPPPKGSQIDSQAIAAATALASRVTLVSGGPGTGKTTTVGRILALLLATDPELRVALAAPTGKAAARLGEAVAEQAARLPVDDTLRARFPDSASTLHRLLGYQPRKDHFRHHEDRPLALDLLVIDEVSMVDLLLMDVAIQALPISARIILLGDKDQLTSVETGSVFGDLCDAAHLGIGQRSKGFLDLHQALSGGRLPIPEAAGEAPPNLLGDAAVELTTNYRFRDQPGIGELAINLRRGDATSAFTVFDDPAHAEVSRLEPTEDIGAALAPIHEPLSAYLTAPSPAEALERLGEFRVLCARRQGPWGVERLNLAIERHLVASGHQVEEGFYSARPILITANDYQLQLFNGDLGICWLDSGRLWAFFPGSGDTPRRLPLARLPPHETAWAMTVHKSQGSEFDRVLLVLGDTDSRVMTRELLYTGATRARRTVMVVASKDVLRAAVARLSRRVSGLADALTGTPAEPQVAQGPASDQTVPKPKPKPEPPDDEGQLSLFG